MAFKNAKTKKANFIGRSNELQFFTEHILEPEAPLYNIISISGQGGVGKTTLVIHLMDLANSPPFKDYCLAALVNDLQITPVSIMEKLAEQLNIAGKFEKELRQYKEVLHKIQNSHLATQNTLLRKVAVDSVTSIAQNVPLVGGFLEKEAEPVLEYVFSELHNRQQIKDAQRMEDPLRGLTNAFIEELNNLTDDTVLQGRLKRHQRVILFFDTFEHLAAEIAPWLLNYFLQSEIDINYDVILIIAGRDSIERTTSEDPKQWLSYRDNGILYQINLSSFTKDETHSYLKERGIIDENIIDKIWYVSQGLPLYLSLLTFNPQTNIDPTSDVVANFLRWIPEQDHIKRQLALDASLFSRPFNQDDLEAFQYTKEAEDTCTSLYQWLIRLPFIKSTQEGRYNYHELAQDLFRRHLYQRSQKEFYATCHKLIDYYSSILDENKAEKETRTKYSSEKVDLTLARAYILLLLPDEVHYIKAIEEMLEIYHETSQKSKVIRLLQDLIQVTNSILAKSDTLKLAKTLLKYFEANRESTNFLEKAKAAENLVKVMNNYLSSSNGQTLRVCYNLGVAYLMLEEYERAVCEVNSILEINTNYTNAYHIRGLIYEKQKRFRLALADCTQAITLNPREAIFYYNRGLVYTKLQEYQLGIISILRGEKNR